jgi:retron-type reverse transcriptase
MKETRPNKYDNFEILTDFGNLYEAHCKCRLGKRWKDSVAIYDIRALECTLYLQYLLTTGRYKISRYHSFTINERGKQRNIKSTQYKDRVVQKCLTDQIIRPHIMPKLIYDNGASVRGKGTDFALDRLKEHMQQYFRKYGSEGWVLVGDFSKFFDSINHEHINSLYEKEYKDEKIMAMIRHIHASIPGGIGVPLGNELSQIDALLEISDIDHSIKEQLHRKWYGRYNDDFYIIGNTKEELKHCLEWITKQAEARGLRLNTKKTKIVSLQAGINFLGFHTYMTKSGKVVMRIKAKSKSRERQKLRKHKKKLIAGEMTMAAVREGYKAWKAHASRGNTYYVLQEMDCYFYGLFYEYITDEEKVKYEKLKISQSIRVAKRKARRKNKHGKSIKQLADRRKS